MAGCLRLGNLTYIYYFYLPYQPTKPTNKQRRTSRRSNSRACTPLTWLPTEWSTDWTESLTDQQTNWLTDFINHQAQRHCITEAIIVTNYRITHSCAYTYDDVDICISFLSPPSACVCAPVSSPSFWLWTWCFVTTRAVSIPRRPAARFLKIKLIGGHV